MEKLLHLVGVLFELKTIWSL